MIIVYRARYFRGAAPRIQNRRSKQSHHTSQGLTNPHPQAVHSGTAQVSDEKVRRVKEELKVAGDAVMAASRAGHVTEFELLWWVLCLREETETLRAFRISQGQASPAIFKYFAQELVGDLHLQGNTRLQRLSRVLADYESQQDVVAAGGALLPALDTDAAVGGTPLLGTPMRLLVPGGDLAKTRTKSKQRSKNAAACALSGGGGGGGGPLDGGGFVRGNSKGSGGSKVSMRSGSKIAR